MNNTDQNKRSKILSSLFSIITPGLGHLYNGRLIWAITIPIVLIFISSILYYSSLVKSFLFLIVLVVFTLATYIFSIVHTVIIAAKNFNYQLKNYNRIYVYLLWPVLFFGSNQFLPENNSIKTFYIPTDGMENTLMTDDMILGDMNHYSSNKLKRNDLVIFKDQKNSNQILIKRVIAFEGEKVSIKNGKIFINEKEYNEDNPDIILNKVSEDIHETAIPKDHIFVMGDNRANSLDSRHFGTIPEKNIMGKPLYIYFSNSFDRIGIYLD